MGRQLRLSLCLDNATILIIIRRKVCVRTETYKLLRAASSQTNETTPLLSDRVSSSVQNFCTCDNHFCQYSYKKMYTEIADITKTNVHHDKCRFIIYLQ